jgi:polar amino acid transport system ATP-binding protein
MTESVSLEGKGIHLSFGRNKVLRGVDIYAAAGHTVALIGPSGSGKSTLLRALSRLNEPDRGDILLDGKSVLADDPDAVRQRIGMVFQHFNLFPHMTALDNVSLAPIRVLRVSRDEARKRGREMLERVGLADKLDTYPVALSGGQQQRVAIARALAMQPKLMLFDEPTSALDPELVGDVLDAMRQLAREGMTMIVVTHEMGFARQVADRVVFMDQGELVEINAPQPFFDNPQHERTRLFLSQILH